jgi:hypothetical protein
MRTSRTSLRAFPGNPGKPSLKKGRGNLTPVFNWKIGFPHPRPLSLQKERGVLRKVITSYNCAFVLLTPSKENCQFVPRLREILRPKEKNCIENILRSEFRYKMFSSRCSSIQFFRKAPVTLELTFVLRNDKSPTTNNQQLN